MKITTALTCDLCSKMQFTKNFQRFRLVTFDITDTLLRFKEDPVRVYAKTAAELGITDINEKRLEICFRQQFKAMAKQHPNFGSKNFGWKQWWVELVKKTFRCAKPNADEKTLNHLAEHLVKIFRTKHCWNRVECGEALVQKVRECGIPVGCISNFDPSLRVVLHEMNILQYFDFILTSYEANVQKPERKIFDIALKNGGRDINGGNSQIEPSDALHIGNSLELDYLGALNAGWSGLLVSKNATKLTDIKEDFVYENICDMLKALETKTIQW